VQAARARLGLPVAGDGDDGDKVDPEATAVVRAARAELEDATREQKRLEGLVKDEIVSQSSVDTAVARRLAAESDLQDAFEEIENRRAVLSQRRAELELAQQKLADVAILAPFDGAVAGRLADRGEFLDPGAAIVRVVRFDPVRLRLRVPEPRAPLVREGQAVEVEIQAGASTRQGRIVRLSPELEARSRTLWVEAEFENADGALRPGSFAAAAIVLDADSRALVVPLAALVRFAGIDRVFVVADGHALERRVTIGRTDAERAEVQEGLRAGETVVVSPGSLRAGAAVRLSP
jgi:RND family efflux transporter MFP subunit